MGNSFTSCCSTVAKGQGTIQSAPSSATGVSFAFSHVFAVNNKGRIDDFYDVSKYNPLGEGTTHGGMVYKAVHKTSKVERAVKSISNGAAGELPPEVLVLRSMDHPNIVKLYETFQDAKRTYLVMEVCTGGELLEAVMRASSTGQFTEQQAATYLEQCLASIIYMHSNNIVHRDIRLENFLLQDSLGSAELKLIDFGCATQCEGDSASMTTKCSSAHYTAPEMLQGAYSKKCDVWSCGVLLYIMLGGSPPFGGDDDAQILKVVAEARVDFPGGQWDPISKTAKEFIGMMLVKDPQQRSSAEPLIKHLFIRCGDVAGRQPLPSMVKKLQGFNTARQLKKVCLTVIAKQLSKSDVEDLRLYFKGLDKNSDGTISKQELVDGLSEVSRTIPGMNTKELGLLMDSIDSDGSGSIDYTEFLAAALDRKTYQKRDVMWAAFRTLDVDGSGKIEKSELKTLLESTGQTDVSDKKIADMMNEADKDKDGKLDFEEFMAMILEE